MPPTFAEAAAAVGLVGHEGDPMRKVAIPRPYHLFATGILSYPLVRSASTPGPSDPWSHPGIAANVTRTAVGNPSQPTSRSDV